MKISFARYPIVVATHLHTPTPEEICADLDALWAGLLERTGPFVLVDDPTQVPAFGANLRRAIGEHVTAHEPAETKRRCRGLSVVVDNALVRGALTAIMWFIRPPYPIKPVASLEDGLAWAREQLRTPASEARA